MVIALIPARGGSKSIPRKNLQVVGGKPLIVHSIDVARLCPMIDRTFVSTDDAEIADVSREAGAEVIPRPSCLADDWTTDHPVFLHTLALLNAAEHIRPEYIIHLRPTHPAREMGVIESAVQMLRRHPEADSLRSVSVATQTPYKMWRVTDEGLLTPITDLPDVVEPFNQPRQQLPIVYWQDGYVDVTRWKTIMELGSMTGRHILPFFNYEDGVEIDYTSDLARADALLRSTRMSGTGVASRSRTGVKHPV